MHNAYSLAGLVCRLSFPELIVSSLLVSPDEMATARCPSRKPAEQTSPQGRPLAVARAHRRKYPLRGGRPFAVGKESCDDKNSYLSVL